MACIAWTIGQSGRSVSDFESLSFHVIAPQEQIAGGVFSEQMSKSSIGEKVKRRVSGYSSDDDYRELQRWYKDFFTPALARADVGCISWESVTDKTDEASVGEFHSRCRRFNMKFLL